MSLFGWALTATVMMMSMPVDPILIGIDSNGTRVISKDDDPLFKTEIVNFIRRFCSLSYNFDHLTFNQNIGAATDLMGLELWKSQKTKILTMQKKVVNEKISHSATIKQINRLGPMQFAVLLDTSRTRRMKNEDQQLAILINLAKIKRTSSNPWGMEVIELEEKEIKNVN